MLRLERSPRGARTRPLVALLVAAWLGGPTAAESHGRIKAEAALSEAEVRQIEAGDILAKVLDSPDRAEVVSFAALRVRASTGRFLGCVRDPSCLKAHREVLEVGRFGPAPSAKDLAGLSLDLRDREYLSRCAISDCDVRLPDQAIERFRTGIDWSSPRSAATAAELFRDTLAGFASAYLEGGNSALATYHDNPRPVSVGATTNELLRRRWFMLDESAELVAYLRDFPKAPLATEDDFLYWYKEKFWRKTVVSLNHVTAYRKSDGEASQVFVTSKQLFASHYLEAGIELLVFTSDPGGEEGTLVFLSRVRADTRPSGFTWPERLIIHHLVRERLEHQFGLLRSRLELSPGKGPNKPS